MIIYNVSIKINPEIREEWLQWMKEVHIPDVMKTGLFHEHKMSRLLEQDENEGVTFVIQYLCVSMESYNTYREKFALKMQQEVRKKFEGKFVAYRTLMEEV